MICDEFDRLSPNEKTIFIGELVHSAMNDSDLFRICSKVVQAAVEKGLFDGVTVMPTPIDGQVIPEA